MTGQSNLLLLKIRTVVAGEGWEDDWREMCRNFVW